WARDPARRAVLRRVLVLPADHRAGGGRHRRLRGRQRDAEDDPHALGRALADLRRQGARGADLRVRGARGLRADRADPRRPLLGFQPPDLAVGERDLGRALAAAAQRDRARLLPADDRGRVAGDPALDGDAQLGCRRGGDADALADHAAARDHLGAGLPATLPAAATVQRVAGPAARSDRLGAGRTCRLGVRPVRRSGAWLGVYLLFEARRRRRVKNLPTRQESALSFRTMSFTAVSSDVRARSVPTIMGQVMFLVAAALGVCALGTYLGRDLAFGTARALSFVGLGMLIAQSFVARLRYGSLGIGWLAGIAAAIGFGLGPTINYYATVAPNTLTSAIALTALTVLAMGSIGFAM